MLKNLLKGDITALEIVVFIIAAVLATLAMVIVINCCAQCCCSSVNGLQRCEQEDKRFFDKDYYDEICTLLYRHEQMEKKQNEWYDEMKRKKETHENEPENRTEMHQKRSLTNSERLLLLKQELQQYKIDHNIEIKNPRVTAEGMANKRRTWIGLEDDGQFEPVQMPATTASQAVQTTSTLERRSTAKNGHETTV